MFTDPQTQTGSDAETPIAERFGKWRMYHRRKPDGSIQWCAYQPDQLDEPMFPAPKGDRYRAPRYGATTGTGQEVLTKLQLAMAKAAA
jgi:hypothetical protein